MIVSAVKNPPFSPPKPFGFLPISYLVAPLSLPRDLGSSLFFDPTWSFAPRFLFDPASFGVLMAPSSSTSGPDSLSISAYPAGPGLLLSEKPPQGYLEPPLGILYSLNRSSEHLRTPLSPEIIFIPPLRCAGALKSDPPLHDGAYRPDGNIWNPKQTDCWGCCQPGERQYCLTKTSSGVAFLKNTS